MSPTYRAASTDLGTERELRRNPLSSQTITETSSTRSFAPSTSQIERDALFADFSPLIQRLIRRYGSDPELREDLQGEIYFRFCALLDLYDPARGVPLRAYLVRQLAASVFTYARQHWRLGRREMELDTWSGDYQGGDLKDPTSDWDDALFLQQVCSRLPEAIAQLPVRQAQVLIWRYFEERSYESIAETLQVQPATVRSLMRHALNNLRRWFNVTSQTTS